MKIGLITNIVLLTILSGCKPPSSGEQVGVKYPLIYMELQQTALPSQLIVPVQDVKVKSIQDTWGAARSNGRTHQGVDIFARRGTPVLSATQGIITRIGTNQLGGNVVWVVGPSLSRHYYAHLERYAENLNEGDWVEQGDIIGYVGNSGNAINTPPHLHYGIYLNGQGAINPYPFLSQNVKPQHDSLNQ